MHDLLLDTTAELERAPATWELAAHGLAVARQASAAGASPLHVSALECLATQRAAEVGDDDPDDLQLLSRYGADLLAAHRHTGDVTYAACAHDPSPTVCPDLLRDWWLTWYHHTRDGTPATDTLDAVMEAADGHPDAVAAVFRWSNATANIVSRTAERNPRALVIVDRWAQRAARGGGDRLLAAAIGRWGWQEVDGTAVVDVPAVVAIWAYRHPQLRRLPVPTVSIAGPETIETVAMMLRSPEGRDALDISWDRQLEAFSPHDPYLTLTGDVTPLFP